MASVVIFDVVANLPSATQWNARFFFYATDTNTMYVSDGAAWQTVGTGSGALEVTDGGTTVNPVTEIDFTAGAVVTDGGGGVAEIAISAAADISVTDGGTTVDPVSEIDFTSGATVTDGGGGVAQIAIAASPLEVTDGITTVNPTSELDFTAGAVVTDAGGGVAQVEITASADISVTDGDTTVSPITEIDFTDGAIVTDGGGGVAQVEVIGTSLQTTDGIITVVPTTILHFVSGATVTDVGGGEADIAITAAPQDLTSIDFTLSAGVDWASGLTNWFVAGSSGAGSPGFRTDLTSIPVVVAPASAVASVGSGLCLVGIPVDVDAYDLNFQLMVTDLTTTNLLYVTAFAQTTPGDTTLSIDWTTATPSVIRGTDLAWDGTNIVNSTAGGIFVASLTVNTTWD